MRKFIFLDIDGVCNSNKYFSSPAYAEESSGKSDALIMLVNHYLHLDPAALKLVNQLVDKSGAEVVVSSTWKSKYSEEEFNKMFADRGATFKVVGRTPHVYGRKFSEDVPRGLEIQAYLDGLSEKPEAFVILDDRSDMKHLVKYLIQTKYEDGLTRLHVDKALRILNGDM